MDEADSGLKGDRARAIVLLYVDEHKSIQRQQASPYCTEQTLIPVVLRRIGRVNVGRD